MFVAKRAMTWKQKNVYFGNRILSEFLKILKNSQKIKSKYFDVNLKAGQLS